MRHTSITALILGLQTSTMIACEGPSGPQGATGAQGPMGATGPAGAPGPAGDAGGSAEALFPEDFGALGDGQTDDTVALQAALDSAQASGKPLHLRSHYRVSQQSGAKDNKWCLLVARSVEVIGIGTQKDELTKRGSPKAWIEPLPSVAEDVDIIKLRGESETDLSFTHFENIRLGGRPAAAAIGNRALYIDTTGTKHHFGYARFLDLNIFPTKSGYAIAHHNDQDLDTGGLYLSTFQGGQWFGAIEFEQTGSGNLIDHVYIGQNSTGLAVSFNQVPGGVGVHIRDNIVGGALRFGSGKRIIVSDNNLELHDGDGSGGAIIQFAGDRGVILGAIVEGNTMGNYTTSDKLVNHILVGSEVTDTSIGPNAWFTGNVEQKAHGYWITNSGLRTVIDRPQTFHCGTIKCDHWLNDLTSGAVYSPQTCACP